MCFCLSHFPRQFTPSLRQPHMCLRQLFLCLHVFLFKPLPTPVYTKLTPATHVFTPVVFVFTCVFAVTPVSIPAHTHFTPPRAVFATASDVCARHLEQDHSQQAHVPLILPAPSTPLTPPSWPTIQPALVAAPRTTVYTANSTTRAPAQAVRAARWHIACAPDPLRKPHGDRTFRFERRCSGSRRGYLRQR